MHHLLNSMTVYAAEIAENCSNVNGEEFCTVEIEGLEAVVANFLGIAVGLAAMLAIISLFFGAFKYMTSRGDPKATDSARSTITWSIGGLVAIFVAYLVIRVVAEFSGIPSLTEFKINTP